jgi:hypothetical protein
MCCVIASLSSFMIFSSSGDCAFSALAHNSRTRSGGGLSIKINSTGDSNDRPHPRPIQKSMYVTRAKLRIRNVRGPMENTDAVGANCTLTRTAEPRSSRRRETP